MSTLLRAFQAPRLQEAAITSWITRWSLPMQASLFVTLRKFSMYDSNTTDQPLAANDPFQRKLENAVHAELVKLPQAARGPSSRQPVVDDDEEVEARQLPAAKADEIGGPKGLEPTRFGDWERNGRCSDF
jgi:hypothetical protein